MGPQTNKCIAHGTGKTVGGHTSAAERARTARGERPRCSAVLGALSDRSQSAAATACDEECFRTIAHANAQNQRVYPLTIPHAFDTAAVAAARERACAQYAAQQHIRCSINQSFISCCTVGTHRTGRREGVESIGRSVGRRLDPNGFDCLRSGIVEVARGRQLQTALFQNLIAPLNVRSCTAAQHT
jgi:hypothetical protein